MGGWGQRKLAVLDSYFTIVVVAFAVLAVVGAATTYGTYVDPGTEVESEQRASARYAGTFTHNATVQAENPVFPVGQTLSDRAVYFATIAPVLNGTFTYNYTATDGGDVAADGTLRLVTRAVEERGDGSRIEHWRTTRELDRANASSLEPGESLRLTFSENVTELVNETERIERDLGRSPGTMRTAIVATITTDGTVNDEAVSQRRQYELGIEPDGDTYQVSDPGLVANTSDQEEQVVVQKQYGVVRSLGGPLALIVGLGGVSGMLFARQNGHLVVSLRERRYMRYEATRQEFDDWITTGHVPPTVLDRQTVEVETLEGLVDVAIDANRRVVEDVASDTFVIPVDDVIYRYTAPPAPTTPILGSVGDGNDVAADPVAANGQQGDEGQSPTGQGESDGQAR